MLVYLSKLKSTCTAYGMLKRTRRVGEDPISSVVDDLFRFFLDFFLLEEAQFLLAVEGVGATGMV